MPAMFESGFFVSEPAWHGLGNLIPDGKRLTVAEAIKAAGMDWEVGLIPLCVDENPQTKELGIVGESVTHRATIRLKDKQILGVVGPTYNPVQNIESFSWFQPFLDREEAEFHTAGSLYGGKITWVLAKLNRKPIKVVKGDEVTKFLLLTNSHDGTKAVQIGFTPIRVVCANTLAMAERCEASELLKVKHRSNVIENLENIRETVNALDAKFEATAEQYKLLASKGINQKSLQRYVEVVMKETKRQSVLETIFSHFEDGYGTDLKDVRGTWWAAYNAVAQYLSYDAGRKNDRAVRDGTRLKSLWYGEYAKANFRALQVAVKGATGQAI